MENWKPIDDTYSVSTYGRVRNDKTGHILAPGTDSNGYLHVNLNGSLKRIHRLVATAFIPNPDNLPEINHIDGNKKNPHKDNLEWCTRTYNINRVSNKRKPTKAGIECVETGIVYPTVEAAAKAVNRSSMAIRKVLYGQTKTSAGLHWRYHYDYQSGSNTRGKGTHSVAC